MDFMGFFNELINKYRLILVSATTVIFFGTCFFEITNYECDSVKGIIAYFAILGSLHIVHELFINYINPYFKNKKEKQQKEQDYEQKVQKAINNFDSLTKDEKQILWQIFFKKNNRFLEYKVKDFISNGYFKKDIQVMTSREHSPLKEVIVELCPEVEKFMEETHNNYILNELLNLNDYETEILNMFIEETENEKFEHSMLSSKAYYSLRGLEGKHLLVLTYKDFQYLSDIEKCCLTDYSIKNFSSFSEKPILRNNVKINLNKVKSGIVAGGSGVIG